MLAPLWALPCALGAAALFGTANVAQMRAARRTATSTRRPGALLIPLLRDRLWLAGFGASVLGYLLQAVALYAAPVVLVQPLIVAELLFALPLAAALAGTRLGRREWAGAVLVAGGLAVFELMTRPSGQRTHLPLSRWAAMTLGVALAVLLAVAVSRWMTQRPMVRAGALAAGASACFGLMSVDTKVVGREFADDGVGALLHVQPWLLAAVAITGLALTQNAFRIAPLSVSLPLIDVGEPVVASLLAVTAFQERLGSGNAVAAGVAGSLVLVVAGVTVLNTSPLVRAAQQAIRSEDPTLRSIRGE